MWDRLWIGVHLATLDPTATQDAYGCIRDGAIASRDGRIVWLGRRQDLPDAPESLAREVITCSAGIHAADPVGARMPWVTPGLIDAHTHLVFAGDRSAEFERRLNGVSYEEIARAGGGIAATVRATRAANEEELLEIALRRAQAMIAAGTTTIEIKSGYGLTLADEVKQLRVARAVGERLPVRVHTTFLGAHALPPEFAGRQDDYVTHLIEDMLPEIARLGLADSVDAFCESIAFTAPQVDRLFAAARELGLPVRLHADQLSDGGGASLAAKYRALSADHVEYVGEEGAAALAEAGTVAMLLPGAFYFIRETQAPPVDLFRRYGVLMGLATDCNPGTSPLSSLTATMNLASVLFRLTPEEALRAVTRIAAQALGMCGDIGVLSTGSFADFVLWDVTGPHELSYWIGGVTPIARVFGGVPDGV